MQAAGTALCDALLPSIPHQSQDVFPSGKTPRDALRLVRPSLTEGAKRYIASLLPFSSVFFRHAASPFAFSPAGNGTTRYFPRAAAIRPANLSRRDSADATPFLSGISYNADT